MKMKALIKTEKGKGFLEVKDVAIPKVADREVLIKIFAGGVCGTDIHIYNDEFPYWPPVILGHEFSGTIIEVGKKVVDWKVGDRVVGEPHTNACGKCYLCRTGNPQICFAKRSPGWGINGAFTNYMNWPEPNLLHKIPDSLNLEKAVLAEPLANVISDIILNNSIRPGDTVLVAGTGPIGILSAVVAKYAGADIVIIMGRNKYKLNVCKNINSIDYVLNINSNNLIEFVENLTNGKGIDTFIEATGSFSALRVGAKLIKKLGKVSAIGFSGKDTIEFPYDQLMMKGVRFQYNISTKYESWDLALKLLDKNIIPFEKIITQKTSIDNWKNVFESSNNHSLKTMFLFNANN